MKKCFVILVIFLCLFILGNCSKKFDQKMQITIDDFELISTNIFDPAGGQFSYHLLTLTGSGSSKWKELNIVLNDLLYNGLSVVEYLNKEKNKSKTNYKIIKYLYTMIGRYVENSFQLKEE